MKIIHLEAEFLPHLGYQVNILSKYMAKLGHEVIILSTELNVIRKHQQSYMNPSQVISDEEFYKSHNVKIIRFKCYGIISDRHIWTINVFSRIKELQPDLIFVHDNDTFVSMIYLLAYLKKIGIPVIFDSHMTEIASKNKLAFFFRFIYGLLITPIIIKNRIYVVRTLDDNFVQKAFKIPESLSPIISFGSDIDLFKPNPKLKNELRSYYKISNNELVFVYSGKLSKDKKGLFFAESILESFNKNGAKKNAVFLIISSVEGEYGVNVENKLLNSQNRIIKLSFMKYTELPLIFNLADVAVIPYAASLTYFDYLSSGLPVIWSNIAINNNRSDQSFVELFENENIKSFREKIELFLNLDDEKLFLKSRLARDFVVRNFSYEKITNEFLELISQEISYRRNNPFK